MIRDNYTLLELFDCRNFSIGFERARWETWGEIREQTLRVADSEVSTSLSKRSTMST